MEVNNNLIIYISVYRAGFILEAALDFVLRTPL